MSKSFGFHRKGWSVFVWLCIAMMVVYWALIAVVRLSIRRDIAYGDAVIAAYTKDADLHALKPTSDDDPAFTSNGLLTDAARSARCTQVVASLRDFQKRWLDSSVFDGHKVHSRFLAAVMATTVEAPAARNGCISTADFDEFLTRLHAIRASDLGVPVFHDLAARTPLPSYDGHWPAFFTLHSLRVIQWDSLLNDRRLQLLRCSADVRCNSHDMLQHLDDKLIEAGEAKA